MQARLRLPFEIARLQQASCVCVWGLRGEGTCQRPGRRLQWQVQEVVLYAQKAVLHPIAPLYDVVCSAPLPHIWRKANLLLLIYYLPTLARGAQAQQQLQPACVRALTRVFRLCDADGDGTLNNAELNSFQVQCFTSPLSMEELECVKRVVSDRQPVGALERQPGPRL